MIVIKPLRQLHLDVSGSVDVTDPVAVAGELQRLLSNCYRGEDMSIAGRMVADLARLHRGEYPGFHACDLPYHNMQHVLDVTLCMARLIVGYEQSAPVRERLGSDLARLGIAMALFHDAGYIRRLRDSRHSNGAAYTLTHVGRSARFLRDYLPTVGMARWVDCAACLVHFTGYEKPLDAIKVQGLAQRRLGELLGTADLIAQMADADYPRKCRDHLYREFEEGGLAGPDGTIGYQGEIYRSADELLAGTPDFIESTIRDRLDGAFGSAYRHAAHSLDGRNLYMDAIEDNRSRLRSALAAARA